MRRQQVLILFALSFVLASAIPASGSDIAVDSTNGPTGTEVGASSSGVARTAETFTTAGRGPGTVRVEVLVEPGELDQAIDAVDEVGGRVVASTSSIVLADVPLASVDTLESSTDVIETVRDPAMINVPPQTVGSFTTAIGQGQLKTVVGADAWHAQGQIGTGARVGIIDFFSQPAWNAAQAAGRLPAPAGTFCRKINTPCNLWAENETHGVSIAEGIHQIAPGASLYLATVGTVTDLKAAIQWFETQGVTIVNRSLASYLDGPGNGTGPLNTEVNIAVAKGMTWFNAAGNHASNGITDGRYWRGSWVDTNGNGWLEFDGNDERMQLRCTSEIQGFRWSDWGGNATNYDVRIEDFSGGLLAESTANQTTGSPPLEFTKPHQINCAQHPFIWMKVRLVHPGNGTAGDILEFMVNNGGLEYWQNPYSASGPIVDSSNPGVMAVGAIDPGDGTVIASYSSRGPTNDGRIKPSIVAPSCYPTVASGPLCSNGTSAATPVTTGVAALLSASGVATTPGSITAYIRSNAIDRGPVGPDNTYGSGQLRLGAPPFQLGSDAHDFGLVDTSQGLWHMYDGAGKQVKQFYFGNPGDYPIVGDWNCDGIETVGMYRQSDGFVYLRNSNTQGNADIRFFFGNPGDVPIAGDFDGDGCDTVSIYRPSNQTFYIINKLGANDGGLGAASVSYIFGNPGDKPFVGDFDGDGVETVGLHRESTGLVYFRNAHTQGNAHHQFIFGDPGDRLFAGDWNNDSKFSPGLFRPSNRIAYFRFTNTAGNADVQFPPAGAQSNWIPVSGIFD